MAQAGVAQVGATQVSVAQADAMRAGTAQAGTAQAGAAQAGAMRVDAAQAGAERFVTSESPARRAVVFCVGNRLMLDEGIGPAVYDEVLKRYELPDNVAFFDVGCMSLDMLGYVESCDVILTVDAVDGTGDEPGTVYRFEPDAMARHSGAMSSLHDLKLVDLFDAASLLGYEAEGFCLGMQVENMSPKEYTVGLTPKVHDALPLLVEAVVAELDRRGFPLEPKEENASL